MDDAKDSLLKSKRGISFDAIVEALAAQGPVWTKDHPRPGNYPGQRLLAVMIAGYVYIVPYEETDDEVTFKTIYPSRRATKAYRRARGKNNGQGPQ